MSMRVLQRVVEEGSFAAAARALDLSPAVVTRLVADLESHLGARLLQRSTRRLALTDVGEIYIERLRHILSDIDETDALVGDRHQELAGPLRISAPPVLATHILASLVTSFRAQYPRIHFDLTVDASESPSIETHDITLIGTGRGADTAMIARRIVDTYSVLVASPAYLTRHGRPTSPADLQHHDCLRLRLPGTRPSSWRLMRDDSDAAPVDVEVSTVLWANHIESLLRASLEGAGITATSLELAAPYLRRGELERVLPPWITGRYSIYAALPSRRFLPRRTQAFLEHLTLHTKALAISP